MSECLWWNVLFLSGAKPMIKLCHVSPPDGISTSIWWVLQPHGGPNWSSPHVYRSKWYCPSGMVLHIKSYALHGLIIHRGHSNVKHISSSILLNICIKPPIHQSIAQRHYKNLQYKIGETNKASYWVSVHKKRKISRKISSKPCK
jgi:hypothetical protein